jgi:hypothetical protein
MVYRTVPEVNKRYTKPGAPRTPRTGGVLSAAVGTAGRGAGRNEVFGGQYQLALMPSHY